MRIPDQRCGSVEHMTKPELKAKLTDFGIPYSEGASKSDLQRIHDEALEAGVFDGEKTEEVAAETPEMETAVPSEDIEATLEEVAEPKELLAGEYEVMSSLQHDGESFEAGDYIELPEEVAKYLQSEGVVK